MWLSREFKKISNDLIAKKIINKKFKASNLRSAYALYSYILFGKNVTQAKYVHDVLCHENFEIGRTYINDIIFGELQEKKEKGLCIVKIKNDPLYCDDGNFDIIKIVAGPFKNQRDVLLEIISKNPQQKDVVPGLTKYKYVFTNSSTGKKLKSGVRRHYRIGSANIISKNNIYHDLFICFC
jgi:hypothetical protein